MSGFKKKEKTETKLLENSWLTVNTRRKDEDKLYISREIPGVSVSIL